MNKLYPLLFVSFIFFAGIVPLKIFAQCNCDPITPATPITYLDTVLATQASHTIFSFPKFDPSIGTLSCISFNDTVSVVVTTIARNTDTTVGHNYVFQTTVSDVVSGPRNSGPFNWLASFKVANNSYGPVFLDQDLRDKIPPQPPLPGDSVVFGPDTLINNAIGAGSPPDITPFIGASGTVDFAIDLSGGAPAIVGGLNYVSGIQSNSWGAFRLTYYWCPALVLATNINNFTAFKKGKNIQLQWQTQNEENGSSYEIEYSRDGSHYMPVGNLQAAFSEGDVAASYQFLYGISASDAGRLYFRVKHTAASGKATYTVIKSVNLEAAGMAGYQVYPNPVKNTVMFEFDEVQTGSFIVSLISTAGQVIQQKQVTLTGNNQIRLDLTSPPATGLYYLQARDQTHNQQYITKILIR
jgi:hypothetical protein